MNDTKDTTTIVAGGEQSPELSAEEKMIQDGFNELLAAYLKSNHRRKVERITKAFNFANQAHAGVKRRSGEPYIMHPIAVAKIVCIEMGLGSTSICSALLHDVVEDTEYTVEDIRDMFGDKIAQIVDGLTKISGGIFGEQASAQAENFRKLLLTMSDDIRVILIKIADRLHNMRTLGSMLPAKQFKIAGETLYLYAPLAHRLGLFSIKTELEDLSFKYEHPKEYEEISKKLEATAESRNRLFEHFAAPVHEKLKAMGLHYEMQSRVKSVYSIWNKMETKKVPFEDIYDIYAVRIIFDPLPGVDEKNQCWDIYSAITDIYRIRPDRIRDWVSRPKANGYQALHLTVMGPDGQWVEIQIRSRRMDDIAEKGFAAHWKSGSQRPRLPRYHQTEPLFIRDICLYAEGRHQDLAARGYGAGFCLRSPLRHRQQVYRCESKPPPRSSQVEVLTSRSQSPQPEWLGFVTTARAKAKITAVLRRVRKDVAKDGETKVMAALANANVEQSLSNVDTLAMYFGFSKREDFLCAVAKGEVVLSDNVRKILKGKTDNLLFKYVKQALRMATKSSEHEETEEQPKEKPQYDKKKPYILKEEGLQRNYIIADCCKPIPGDDSLGFINDDGNVVVHKRSCPIAMRLKSSFGERILNTVWSNYTNASFEATLEVKGIDATGVLNKMTEIIAEEFNVAITRLLIEAKDGVFEGKIKLKVHDVEDIQKLCVSLSKIDNVKSVTRIAD